MNSCIKVMNVLDHHDVYVVSHPNNRHQYVFCKRCGCMVRMGETYLRIHSKACVEDFKQLCTNDPIPNEETSEYMNLEEHISDG